MLLQSLKDLAQPAKPARRSSLMNRFRSVVGAATKEAKSSTRRDAVPEGHVMISCMLVGE